MQIFENQQYDEERALYGESDITVKACSFDGPADGESALKECENIAVHDCFFNLRYPFWHVNNGVVENCQMTELCRAALWYDDNIILKNCKMHGIKALRECSNIKLDSCDVVSPEVVWRCKNIDINNSSISGEYPFFESKDISLKDSSLKGKYSFQYVENMTITNCNLDTKDAFWHSKNVTVVDSVVKGEYLGWYAENLKFVRCRIIGTQPLCYCKGLVLEDCTMEETDLSFERSEVVAEVKGRIEGVKNPISGKIKADEIGDLLLESKYIDATKTEIICDNIIVKNEI